MAHFDGPLWMEDIDGEQFELLAPVRFYSDKQLIQPLVVPAGYVTDLASIPRGLWNIFPKTGKYDRAAVIHDAGYTHSLETIMGDPVILPKNQVDNLFWEAMIALGVNRVQAWLMWKAVSWFGKMESLPDVRHPA